MRTTGMGRRGLRAVTVAAITALALAGCGDDGDESTSDETVEVDETGDDGASTTTLDAGSETTETSGSPSDDGDDNAAPDAACPLLEGIDAPALLGEPTGEPDERTATCVVRAASVDSRGAISLVASTTSAAENYDNRVELFGVDSEVSGMGDRAFHSGPYLVVLDGEVLLQLQVVRDASLGPGVDDTALESAMTAILANLG